MNRNRYPNEGHAPNASTLFGVTAGWLTFIAVAMATSLGDPTSTGDPVVGLLITVGAAVAAVAFVLLALRVRRAEEAGVPLRVPAPIRPLRRPAQSGDKAA